MGSLNKVRKYGILDATPSITKLLSHENDTIVYSALKTLLYFDEDQGYDFLIEKMKGNDSVNWQLQDWFIKNDKREYIEQLRSLLALKNLLTRSLAATTLVRLGEKVSAQDIIKKFPKRNISSDILYAIAHSGDMTVIPALKDEFQKDHTTETSKVYAAYALAQLGEASYNTYLRELINNTSTIPPSRVLPEGKKRYTTNMEYRDWVKSGNPTWNQVQASITLLGKNMTPEIINDFKELAIRTKNTQTGADIARTAIHQIAKSQDSEAFNILVEMYNEHPELKKFIIKPLFLYKNPITNKIIDKHYHSSIKHYAEDEYFYAETLGWRSLSRTTH